MDQAANYSYLCIAANVNTLINGLQLFAKLLDKSQTYELCAPTGNEHNKELTEMFLSSSKLVSTAL